MHTTSQFSLLIMQAFQRAPTCTQTSRHVTKKLARVRTKLRRLPICQSRTGEEQEGERRVRRGKSRCRQNKVAARWSKGATSSTAYSRRDTDTDTDTQTPAQRHRGQLASTADTDRAISTADTDRGQLAPHTREEQAVTRCTE